MAPDDIRTGLSSAHVSAGVSAAFAAWAAETPADFGAEALHRAKRAFIDIAACLVPGAGDAAAVTLRKAAAAWGTGPCAVAGEPLGRPAPVAALLNGTAAHALDFDDNFDPAKAHITAVLAPALLALADERGAPGLEVLDAYVVGVEIAARVGQGLNPFHRNRGWHATATVGAIGAAAACGRLLRLSPTAMSHCLNMATSYAGGFMSQFGTMAKPLHAGKAAEAGVVCAALAEAGFTAGQETFEGEHGMARLMVGPDLDDLRASDFKREHGQTLRFDTRALGAPPALLQYGLKVKRFPTCGSTHRALDGLLALMAAHGFKADDVSRIDIHAPATHFNNLMYTDPRNGAEARFSMEFCIAVALLKGGIGLADFTPGAVADGRVRGLMPLVRRHPVDKAESEFPTAVAVTLKTGARLETAVDAPKGRADNPMTDAELYEKLMQCCRGALSQDAAGALAEALDGLDSARPVSGVTGLLRSAGNP